MSFFLKSFFCIFTIVLGQLPIFAQTQGGLFYSIQLGVFKNVKAVDVAKLKKIPESLYQEDAGEGRTRLLLGKFSERNMAENILPGVKSSGFSGAYIVERGAQQTAAEPQLPERVFVVQVGAFAKEIPAAEAAKLAKVAFNIYNEKSDNFSKVYIGPYQNADEASEGVSSAKKMGFGQAFRREIGREDLAKMQLYKKGSSTATSAATPPISKDKAGGIVAYNTVRFGDKSSFWEDVSMFSNGVQNDTIYLGGRIMPVGPQELLFAGNLDPRGTEAYQPVLLYTDDSGKTWNEVLQAEYGYHITYLEFAAPKIAYLGVMWVIEGPGELHLYRTDDGGKVWRKVNQVPRNDISCQPVYIHFSDAKKGTIVYMGTDDVYWKWTTDNGGAKWNNKGKISAYEYKKLKNNGMLVYDLKGYYMAADNKTYYRQVDERNIHLIYRRNEKSKKWEEVSRLGCWYKFKDKQIIAY